MAAKTKRQTTVDKTPHTKYRLCKTISTKKSNENEDGLSSYRKINSSCSMQMQFVVVIHSHSCTSDVNHYNGHNISVTISRKTPQ